VGNGPDPGLGRDVPKRQPQVHAVVRYVTESE
jgi:hypothetical protein